MGLSRVPDLDSLVLLLEVAETGSLGRAAAAHGLSQPAVTARIRTMDRTLLQWLLDPLYAVARR